MDQVSSVKLEPVGFDTTPNSSATEVPIKAEPDPSPTTAPAGTSTQSHLQFQQQVTMTSNQPQTTIVTAPAPGEGLQKSYNQVSSTSSLDSALSSKSSNNQVYHLPQTTTINHSVNNAIPTATSTTAAQANSSATVGNTNVPNFVLNTPSPTNDLKNINPVDNATAIRSPVLSSSSTTQQQQQQQQQQQTFTTSSIPTTLSHTNHAPPQSSTATTTTTTPLFNPLQHQQTSQTQYTMGLGTGTTPTIISTNASTNVDLLATSNTTGITSITAPPNITNPATTSSATSTAAANVPEFLYQLIKMLTDDHRDIIEWSNGKIEVHNPHRLESQVLNKYFRHSKYASFQRQLNYFGFRKLAGKGKMAPCSYVNELATSDLRSLLKMKRKTSAKEAAKAAAAASSASELDAANKNTSKISSTTASTSSHSQYNSGQQSTHPAQPATALSSQQSVIEPVLRTTATTIPTTSTTSFPSMNRMTDGGGTSVGSDLKIAIGKGIKHSLNGYLKTSTSGNSITSSSLSLKIPSMTSLSGTNNNHTTANTPSSNAFFPSLSSIPDLSSNSSVLKTGTINNPLLQSNDNSQQFVQQSRSTDPFTIAQSAVGKGVQHQFAPTTSTINVTKQSTIINPVAAPTPTPTPAPPSQTVTTTISTSTAVAQQPKQEDSNVQFTFLDPPQLGMGMENCLTELQNNFRNSLNESIASDNDGGGGGGSNGMTRDTSLLALAMIPGLDTLAAEPTPTSNSAQTGGNNGGGGAGVGPTTVSSTMQQELKVTDDALMTFLDFPPDFGSE